MEELTCCDCGETWQREIKRGAKPPRCPECADRWHKKRALDARKPLLECEDCGSSLHPSTNKRQSDGKLRCGPCGKWHKRKFKHCPECGVEVYGNYKYCDRHKPNAVRQELLKKQCPECGERFVAKTIAQSYCTGPSDGPGNCQKKAERKRAKARGYKQPRVPMICHGCGSEFMGERRKRKPGVREHQYCTHECYSACREWTARKHFKTDLEWRLCARCDTAWLPNKGGKGPRCPTCFPVPIGPHSSIRKKGQPAIWRAGPCRRCGQGFVGFSFNHSNPPEFCSERCVAQTAKDTRRARLANVETKPYSRHEIFERDRWMCQLCQLPVDRHAHYQDDQAPSIDHVVPISLGGPDAPENVQCAHRLCNSRKSNKVQSHEQLAIRL